MDPCPATELIRRHAGLIHKVAYAYCRDAADREDVVQEIAVQLWRSHARFDRRCRESTWVYRIALNVAISFHRRERRHRVRRDPADVQAITVVAPEEPSDEVQRLLACIDVLGALDKALVLLYLDGNEHSAIAEVLGISVSNVGTRISRAKDKLRAMLADDCGRRPKET